MSDTIFAPSEAEKRLCAEYEAWLAMPEQHNIRDLPGDAFEMMFTLEVTTQQIKFLGEFCARWEAEI